MPEPTLAQILDKLEDALNELIEALKRIMDAEALEMLQENGDMKNFKTTVWSPPQSNENTTTTDLDALSVAQLDDWAGQNKTEIERLQNPPEE